MGQQLKYKIILIGNQNVGKTTLFWKYIEGEFLDQKSKQVSTIDFKMKSVELDKKPIKLYIWDTAGQEEYRAIVSTYFKGCHGVIILFSLTDNKSYLDAINQWYPIAQNKAVDAEIIMLANKSDLEHKADINEASEWCKQHSITFIVTSVKKNKNVNEAFMAMCRKIYDSKHKIARTQSFNINGRTQKDKQNKGCC